MIAASTVLALAAAGAAGALLRYLVGVALPARRSIPWGVLVVNVLGSLLAGAAVAAVDDSTVRLLVVAGFCGGLTTFSTQAVDTVRLANGEIGSPHRRAAVRHALAGANVAANLVLACGAAATGYALGGALA